MLYFAPDSLTVVRTVVTKRSKVISVGCVDKQTLAAGAASSNQLPPSTSFFVCFFSLGTWRHFHLVSSWYDVGTRTNESPPGVGGGGHVTPPVCPLVVLMSQNPTGLLVLLSAHSPTSRLISSCVFLCVLCRRLARSADLQHLEHTTLNTRSIYAEKCFVFGDSASFEKPKKKVASASCFHSAVDVALARFPHSIVSIVSIVSTALLFICRLKVVF